MTDEPILSNKKSGSHTKNFYQRTEIQSTAHWLKNCMKQSKENNSTGINANKKTAS